MLSHEVKCRCGKVTLVAQGMPIVATVCHCASCQQAGSMLEALPGAPPILDQEKGTPYVLYRKDRVSCTKGQEWLKSHRLKDTSPTRRVVATCCNSFMFLDFTKGHWVSLSRDRFVDQNTLAQASHKSTRSPFFILRLIMAWTAMGFRTPTIDYVKGELEHV